MMLLAFCIFGFLTLAILAKILLAFTIGLAGDGHFIAAGFCVILSLASFFGWIACIVFGIREFIVMIR